MLRSASRARPFWRFSFVDRRICGVFEVYAPGGLHGKRRRSTIAASLERLARNQVLFREVNERISEVLDSPDGYPVDFMCECSRDDCTETIALDRDEYEAVRSNASLFVVVPGHELLEVERVVNENCRFTLVQKTVAADFAARTDPRSRSRSA